MAIADSTLLLEGQRDFSGGMDSSLVPSLIQDNSVYRAVNVTFRGGTPKTRPGFRQIDLTDGLNSGLSSFVYGFMQGSYFYQDRRVNKNPSIFCVCKGRVIKIDLGTYTVDRLFPVVAATSIISGEQYTIKDVGTTNWVAIGASSATVGITFTASGTGSGTGTAYHISHVLNETVDKAYFVQAENYLIIQTGEDIPLIFDGDLLYQSGTGPADTAGSISQLHTIPSVYGAMMAYGQGRLFVVDVERTSIYAGDLAYGGSTVQLEILKGESPANTHAHIFLKSPSPFGLAVTQSGNDILVGADVAFSIGDYVTISGLTASSTSNPGINGTWKVDDVGTTSGNPYFQIAAVINSNNTDPATGGYVAKANTGEASDLLRFTEGTYLDEGGALQVPSFMGKITGLIFIPVQDIGTGQGDLLVFCETGVISLAVSVPRSQWKETAGFQRVALDQVGATSHESLATTNGDIFFRSIDGLRTYRNARAELNAFGQVPISAELNSVLPYDTLSMLTACSSVVFNNRLLFTASPKLDYTGVSVNEDVTRPITFSTICALDFTTLSTVGAKRTASYDGLWKGLDVTRLVGGLVKLKPRAFALNVNYETDATNELWEITEDAYADEPINSEPIPITSILETRSFSLGSPVEVKKLIRADFWLGNLRGSTTFNVYWRPDEYPCWRTWHSFVRCAQVENCVATGVATEFNVTTGTVTVGFTSSAIRWYRLGISGLYTAPLQHTAGPDDSATVSAALTAAGITHTTVTRSGTFPNHAYVISGMTADLNIIPVRDPGTLEIEPEFAPKNLQPQYRPQIRMPTPPEDADPIVGRPYYFGNDFQFRIQWVGHAQITRILVLGQRQLEQYQGTDYVEVV